jgi:hypothetical protein
LFKSEGFFFFCRALGTGGGAPSSIAESCVDPSMECALTLTASLRALNEDMKSSAAGESPRRFFKCSAAAVFDNLFE